MFLCRKTHFIRDWWSGLVDVTLITRPRRFGKTLTLDTVRTFFSPEFAGRSDLFEGLDIWKDENFRRLQGTVPVIFLSFADIKETTYKDAVDSFKELLRITFRYYARQLADFSLSEWEKQLFAS
ncbi:MAG: AAA family ATPase, partial [Desulfovibrionaceae bacterium]|nr:AAA family ATPase [Desulfovibrionaceae bacterium]